MIKENEAAELVKAIMHLKKITKLGVEKVVAKYVNKNPMQDSFRTSGPNDGLNYPKGKPAKAEAGTEAAKGVKIMTQSMAERGIR